MKKEKEGEAKKLATNNNADKEKLLRWFCLRWKRAISSRIKTHLMCNNQMWQAPITSHSNNVKAEGETKHTHTQARTFARFPIR